MPMIHGRGGRVNFDGSDIAKIVEWTADITCDTAETTAMSDADYWKTYLPGFKGWTATVACNSVGLADGSDLNWDGSDLGGMSDETGITLKLWFTYTDADGGVVGKSILTGIAYNEDKDDIVKVNYTFQGTGEPVFST